MRRQQAHRTPFGCGSDPAKEISGPAKIGRYRQFIGDAVILFSSSKPGWNE
jgi:hypothetical protein